MPVSNVGREPFRGKTCYGLAVISVVAYYFRSRTLTTS